MEDRASYALPPARSGWTEDSEVTGRALALILASSIGCAPLPHSPPADAGQGKDGGGPKDGGTDAGAFPDGGLSLSGACNLLNWRRCEYLARCGLIEPAPTAIRECVAYFTATWCGPHRWVPRVSAGTLLYDGELALECADAFPSRSCADWQTEPLPCSGFLWPNAYLGQACYGLYPECRSGVCRGYCSPRRCQPPGLAGETCDESSDCNGGLFCQIPTSSSTGVGNCTPLGGVGNGCDAQTLCRPELFCNVRWCESRRRPGEACADGTCVSSAFCQQTTDGGMCAERLDAGQGCTDDVQCQAGLLCETISGQCAPVGPLSDGTPCSSQQRCAGRSVCLGATSNQLGSCAPPIGEGQACLTSLDCQSHLTCTLLDGGSQHGCARRLLPGASCTSHRDCQAFSRCQNQLCTRLPLPGSPCLGKSCLFGICEMQADGGGICADLGGPGATCLSDLECGSSRCLYGRCLPACAP